MPRPKSSTDSIIAELEKVLQQANISTDDGYMTIQEIARHRFKIDCPAERHFDQIRHALHALAQNGRLLTKKIRRQTLSGDWTSKPAYKLKD